jgi:hypothetical protein
VKGGKDGRKWERETRDTTAEGAPASWGLTEEGLAMLQGPDAPPAVLEVQSRLAKLLSRSRRVLARAAIGVDPCAHLLVHILIFFGTF